VQRVEVSRVIPGIPADVFAKFTDHVGWTSWAGAGKVTLVREGSPDKNGLGAVRSFSPPMFAILMPLVLNLSEEIIDFEPPSRMVYRIVKGGFPARNPRGEVRFEAHPQGTCVVWKVEITSRIPFTERLIAGVLRRAYKLVLERFEKRAMRLLSEG
jgi:hypothetical protein